MAFDWGPVIGGATGLIGSIYNANQTEEMNKKNLQYQRERDVKQEALMREGWGRDDTAVQRRAADLSDAGMSPLLAAGSAANPSQVMNVQGQEQKMPEHFNVDSIVSAINQGVAMQKTYADMANQREQTQASVNLLDQQKHNAYLDGVLKDREIWRRTGSQQLPIYDEKGKLTGVMQNKADFKGQDDINRDQAAFDAWLSKKSGLRKNDPLNAYTRKRADISAAGSSDANAAYLRKATDLMMWNTILNGLRSAAGVFSTVKGK